MDGGLILGTWFLFLDFFFIPFFFLSSGGVSFGIASFCSVTSVNRRVSLAIYRLGRVQLETYRVAKRKQKGKQRLF